jgi:ATPase subunit of ABC transporter with duplicated ATPase domains
MLDEYVAGVRAGNRAWIARAITLVESTRADHRRLAQELLGSLTPDSGRSRRVGITGVPGVGKSTFIDALGSSLTAADPYPGEHPRRQDPDGPAGRRRERVRAAVTDKRHAGRGGDGDA